MKSRKRVKEGEKEREERRKNVAFDVCFGVVGGREL